MHSKGFSLIETLIVIAIAAGLVIVVSNFSTNVSGLNSLVAVELQAKSDVNVIMQIITTEIRSAGTSANGAYPIDTAGTSTFIFYSDINKDGTMERVRYFLSSSTLYKGVTEPSGMPVGYTTSTEVITDIIDGVTVSSSSPLFTYFDSSYTGTQPALTQPVSISAIRLVGINFSLPAQANEPGSAVQYFSTLVDVRNLRSN